MIRARDTVVLAVLAWWLLRDREETSVELMQTCVGFTGERIRVPLGDCPNGYELETEPIDYPTYQTPPYVPPLNQLQRYGGLRGCGCNGGCKGCS